MQVKSFAQPWDFMFDGLNNRILLKFGIKNYYILQEFLILKYRIL